MCIPAYSTLYEGHVRHEAKHDWERIFPCNRMYVLFTILNQFRIVKADSWRTICIYTADLESEKEKMNSSKTSESHGWEKCSTRFHLLFRWIFLTDTYKCTTLTPFSAPKSTRKLLLPHFHECHESLRSVTSHEPRLSLTSTRHCRCALLAGHSW